MTASAPIAPAHTAAAATDLAPHELRILVAVDRERGFSAAAKVLGLTQSAVSHSIRGTERKVGAVLFERGRKGATPTAAGTAAAAHARRVLRLLDTLAAEARGAERGTVAGPLRIAAFRSAALYLLPPVLERLTARHPGIEPEVHVVRELGAGTAGEVAEGRADLGIATIGASPVPAGLIGDVLIEEPYSLVHPVSHPVPRSLPLVDWHENCGSYTRQWWAGQDWIPKATVLTEDDGAVLSMVSRGLGMAIMPALSLSEAPDGIEITDLGPERPTRSVGYITSPELASSVSVRALIRELRAARQ
ncbi:MULTISPECIES: LysR family transcriptional regulator [unclassified Streptomyces]|uniref:LysR family transcriptional regulator n=1 Tax=unclassified Streptomyces TaxID=2593676 RepID=UPI00224D6A7D|nr:MULTISPECIES: LysR family transcriptional regulator [unclassified Streptomyces]MCX4792879.1 LysR family transcriptional regulator [Streptomyces sp. NBC_01242]WSP60793.1 LysR family transcriptional regulator [Streptomyces sp. NBC_01240]WSU19870.1 LysR family transcriptional regulator [Streptomyces sp. NBC_01108]